MVMELKWSNTDDGYNIRLWHNGVLQILAGGGTTWTGRTMGIGSAATYYKEGLYRNSDAIPTGIVYHDGFQAATTRAGLGVAVTD